MQLKSVSALLLAATALGCKSAANTTSTSATPATPVTASAPSGDIVGTWTQSGGRINNEVTTFKKDGTVDMNGYMPRLSSKIQGTATYKVDGNTLTLHVTSTEFIPDAKANPRLKASIAAMNERNSMPDALKNEKDEVLTISWLSKDRFTTADKTGKVVTFTRQAASAGSKASTPKK